jgi:hypothetical protein
MVWNQLVHVQGHLHLRHKAPEQCGHWRAQRLPVLTGSQKHRRIVQTTESVAKSVVYRVFTRSDGRCRHQHLCDGHSAVSHEREQNQEALQFEQHNKGEPLGADVFPQWRVGDNEMNPG